MTKQKRYGVYGIPRNPKEKDELLGVIEAESIDSRGSQLKDFVRSMDTEEKKRFELYSIWELKDKPKKKKRVITTQDILDHQWQADFGTEILKGYQEGMSMNALKDKYKISQTKIRKFLVDNEVEIRKRGTR